MCNDSIVFVPTYFPDVLMLSHLLPVEQIVLEAHGSYQKQTYRTRSTILAANGKVNLSIPIIHNRKKEHWPFTEVCIDLEKPWASEHLKSIKSAYSSSPFYEFYEDHLLNLYRDIPEKLYDWNLQTLNWTLNRLGWEKKISETKTYANDRTASFLATAKKKTSKYNFLAYDQVFMEKFGFVHNLGFLDLLFNLGPAVTAHLKQQGEILNDQQDD